MDFGCSFANAHSEEILIDADSTKTDTYGKQEDSAFISHYGSVGYHPIVVNEYNTKVLLASYLRKGNTYSADECVPLMEEILNRVDKNYEGRPRPVKFRGDAAFFNHGLMELFEGRKTQSFMPFVQKDMDVWKLTIQLLTMLLSILRTAPILLTVRSIAKSNIR